MKKIIILALFCLINNYDFAQEISFYDGSFENVKAEAKKQNKLIFIDCYTSWCGPCKWMAKNVFTDAKVIKFYNENFLNFKSDMEKGEGKQIRKDYNINGYPTLLYINGDGELQQRSLGGCDTAEFIKIGKKALDLENNFGSLLKKYKSGNREPQFLSKYALECANLNVQFDINEYFKTQSDSELINEINLILIECYITNYKTREFNYLANNFETFSKKYGRLRIENRIVTIITKSLWALDFQKDPLPLPTAINNILSQYNLKDSTKIFYKVQMQYNISKKQPEWQQYAITSNKLIDVISLDSLDNSEISHIINNFSRNVTDTALLKSSLKWCDYLVQKNYLIAESMLCKAKITAQLGNKEEALKVANMAMNEEQKKAKPQLKNYQKFISDLQKN